MATAMDFLANVATLILFSIPFIGGAITIGATMYAFWMGVDGGLVRRITAALGGAALWAAIIFLGRF